MEKGFTIDKLSGSSNYHTWQFAMKNVLTFKGYGKSIESEVAETDEKIRSASKALISLSVEPHIYVHILSATSAYAVWTTLQGLYEDKGLSRKIGLLRNLISTRLESSDNMQSYVDSIVTNANKLKGVGFDLTDEWLAAILLAGLTDEFKPFIMGIEAANTELKSDKIISKLLDSNSGTESKADALFAKNKLKNFNKGNSKKNKQPAKCSYCKKKGHTVDVCFKKKANDENSSDCNAKAAFIARETQNAYAAPSSQLKSSEWYIDSGASSHMTPYQEMLTNIRATNAGPIMSANSA